jgi:hypothetical protein
LAHQYPYLVEQAQHALHQLHVLAQQTDPTHPRIAALLHEAQGRIALNTAHHLLKYILTQSEI